MAQLEYPLTSLYLYLSGRCNLHCRHCWVAPSAPGEEYQVPLPDLKNCILTAKKLGMGAVKLTGGEPFLRHDIAELMTFLRDEGLCIDIESNGTLIDHNMARLIRDCRVRQVSISLDAAEPRQHEVLRGTSGVYEKTVAAIQYLCEEQVTTQVIMSLYNENVSEIEPLAARCEEWGIPSLKINFIMPTGRGEGVFERRENVSITVI